MPQRVRIDEDGVFARGNDIVTVAIDRPQKIGGGYCSPKALEKSARACLIFARHGFDSFHPAVTLAPQNTTSFQAWMKRESVHPIQKGTPFPLAVAGSGFVNHRTGREFEQRDSAAVIVPIGQTTTHINDCPGRVAVQESARKSRSIRCQPGQKFSDVIAPLEN
jgi:hypothetical protein